MLEKTGLITHRRGNVQIIDRRKLEEAACECYAIKRRQTEKWQRDSE
jgi:hypothetical protein